VTGRLPAPSFTLRELPSHVQATAKGRQARYASLVTPDPFLNPIFIVAVSLCHPHRDDRPGSVSQPPLAAGALAFERARTCDRSAEMAGALFILRASRGAILFAERTGGPATRRSSTVDCTPSGRHETTQTFARLYMRSPCLVREGLGPALSRGLRRARRCVRPWRDISARAHACSVARAGRNRSPPRSVFSSGRGRGAKGHQSPGTWPPGSSNLPSNPASLAVEGPFYRPPSERPMSSTLIPGHGHCPRVQYRAPADSPASAPAACKRYFGVSKSDRVHT
jgi:hypothetical protein